MMEREIRKFLTFVIRSVASKTFDIKVLLKRFHMNGHTSGFHLLTRKSRNTLCKTFLHNLIDSGCEKVTGHVSQLQLLLMSST